MPALKKVEPRTELFISLYRYLQYNDKLPDLKVLADIMGYKSHSSISDILAKRVNIRQDALDKLIRKYKDILPDDVMNDYQPYYRFEAKRNSLLNSENHIWNLGEAAHLNTRNDKLEDCDYFEPLGPYFTKSTERNLRKFYVDNLEMHDFISKGDILAIQLIEKFDWINVVDFYIYVIRIGNRNIVGRIYKQSNEVWLLGRDNVDGIIKIDVTIVDELAVVRNVIKVRVPKPIIFNINDKIIENFTEQNSEQNTK